MPNLHLEEYASVEKILEDRRDVEVDQRTVANYNIDIGEESCRIEVIDKNFLD